MELWGWFDRRHRGAAALDFSGVEFDARRVLVRAAFDQLVADRCAEAERLAADAALPDDASTGDELCARLTRRNAGFIEAYYAELEAFHRAHDGSEDRHQVRAGFVKGLLQRIGDRRFAAGHSCSPSGCGDPRVGAAAGPVSAAGPAAVSAS